MPLHKGTKDSHFLSTTKKRNFMIISFPERADTALLDASALN